MANEVGKGDDNHYRVGMAVTNDSNEFIKMLRVDPTTGYLLTGGTNQFGGYTSVISGNATNSSTSTAAGIEAISTPCKLVVVYVPLGNTGTQVSVGGSNVIAVAGSEKGNIIIKGSSQAFYISDASNLYWVPDTPNDSISFNIYD